REPLAPRSGERVAEGRVRGRAAVNSIPIQRADQQSRPNHQHGRTGGHLAGILLGVRGRLVRPVLEVVACGVEILVDVEVGDHLFADSELAEELLETAAAAEGLSAARADAGWCGWRAAVGCAGQACRSESLHV